MAADSTHPHDWPEDLQLLAGEAAPSESHVSGVTEHCCVAQGGSEQRKLNIHELSAEEGDPGRGWECRGLVGLSLAEHLPWASTGIVPSVSMA